MLELCECCGVPVPPEAVEQSAVKLAESTDGEPISIYADKGVIFVSNTNGDQSVVHRSHLRAIAGIAGQFDA